MKKILNRILLLLMCIVSILWVSCKQSAFEERGNFPVKLGYQYQTGLLNVAAKDVIKSDGFVQIPVEINLSEAASSLFSVGFAINKDTVNRMILLNKLSNTILAPDGSYSIPLNTDVRFGLKSFTINLAVSLAELELNYGKKLAIGIDLKSATKNNMIEAGGKTLVVVVNPADIIDQNDVHTLKFITGGERYNVGPGYDGPFVQDASLVTIPLGAALVGTPGVGVSVKVLSNPDTVNKMLAAGVLPANTVAIDHSLLMLPTEPVKIVAGQNKGNFDLKINIKDLARYYGQTVAIGLQLSTPSRYGLDPVDKSQVIVFNTIVLQTITGFLANTTRTFSATSFDGTRWGTPDGWIVNAAAKNHVKNGIAYGGYDKNNTCLALGGVAGDPIITNAKVYQTVTLPAGKYTLVTDHKDVINGANGTFYFAIALGDGIPNTNDVPTATLAFARAVSNAQTFNTTFTITQTSKVSIGFVASSTNGNFEVTVRDIKLLHTYP